MFTIIRRGSRGEYKLVRALLLTIWGILNFQIYYEKIADEEKDVSHGYGRNKPVWMIINSQLKRISKSRGTKLSDNQIYNTWEQWNYTIRKKEIGL